MTAI
ncbi:hypothetical protein VCHC41A1_2824, partial [Vibrio cholerae HC-41A1]|jgi:hypothetical protein